jgi:NAD(P)-dependent dehydrogenase (short-subunit alcohol dehydrogenase family)
MDRIQNYYKYNKQTVWFTLAFLLPLFAWSLSRGSTFTKDSFPLLSEDGLRTVLQGKEFLVVGGGEGVGAAIVNSLVRRGASVTATGTHPSNGLKGVDFIKANISTMRGAQELGDHLAKTRQFDTVLFASGFVPRPILTGRVEGYEEDLETSYLSRFIILNELIRANALIGRKRVYLLAYPGDDPMLASFEDSWFDWQDYKEIPRYVNTVSFNDALVKEAARRFPDLRVYGVNPGFISRSGGSDLHDVHKGLVLSALDRMTSMFMRSPTQYADKILIQILASPELHLHNGAYISEKFQELPPKKWMSKESNRMLVWDNSEKLVGKALG